jgi:hypothetical protein
MWIVTQDFMCSIVVGSLGSLTSNLNRTARKHDGTDFRHPELEPRALRHIDLIEMPNEFVPTPISQEARMTEQEKQQASVLLNQIEAAIGAIPDRSGTNAPLISEILEAVNGLRSLVGVIRGH